MRQRRTASALLLAALLGGLLTTLGATAPGSAAAAAPCSTASTNGTKTVALWAGWDQGIRSYNLHVPAGLTGSAPLLIDLHGLGSNAFFQEVTSGWSQYADSQKFIVAYPAGFAWGQAWNVGEGSADAAFLKKVVADIKGKYCVDSDRVFVEGGSLGGFMAQRMLCDAEDIFAGGASTISSSLDYFSNPCSLDRGVPFAAFGAEGDPLFGSLSAHQKDWWVDKNNCSPGGTPDPNPYGANGAVYGSCDDGAHVLWRTYSTAHANGHAYPTGAALDDLHAKAWSFLMAHPMP